MHRVLQSLKIHKKIDTLRPNDVTTRIVIWCIKNLNQQLLIDIITKSKLRRQKILFYLILNKKLN